MSNSRQSKNPLWSVTRREIHRITGSWVYIFSALLLPMVAFILSTTIFKQGVSHDLPVAVVDKDFSSLSRKVIRAVDATSIAKVTAHYTSETEAYQQMQAGKIRAFLVIPENTSEKMLKKQAAPVKLYTDNTNIVTGGLIYSGIRTAVGTLSTQVKVLTYMKSGKNTAQATALAIPISVKSHTLFNPYNSYAFFLLSGLLPLMLLVFTLLSTVHSFGTELKYGTAPQLLHTANNSIVVAVIGKMLPFTLIYLLHAMVMNYILFFYVGIPVNGNYTMIIWSELLLILAYQFMGILLLALTANMRLSLSLSSAYAMMAFTFAGITFPHFGMPGIAKSFSLIFPFRYWVKAFIGQSMRGEPFAVSMTQLLCVVIFVILGIITLPLMKKRLANEKFYGKI